ncbi:MAG: efflux RND transporter periplasmic adaptor subunit, partial [Marinilabilia sp.]
MITKNKIREINTLCIAVLFVLLQACGSTTNEGHEEHDAHESGHTEEARAETDHSGHDHEAGSLMAVREELGSDQVLITARQKENADVELAHPSKENLSAVVKAFGSVSLPPHAEASITPVIGGIVRDILVIEGDEVQKGEVVARIEHPDVADLQQAYLEAVNEDKYLESEYNRQKRLLRDSVNAARTVQKLESEYENNRARLQSLKKKLQMINIDPGQINPENITSSYLLKASVSGTIASVLVNGGVHVSEEKEIFHIANINEA